MVIAPAMMTAATTATTTAVTAFIAPVAMLAVVLTVAFAAVMVMAALGVAARLAVAGTAAVLVATAAATMATATMAVFALALAVFTAGLGGGFGGSAAEEALQPAEETAGFFRLLGAGGGSFSRHRTALLECGLATFARLAGFQPLAIAATLTTVAAFAMFAALGAESRAFVAAGAGLPALGGTLGFLGWEDVERGLFLGDRSGGGSDGRGGFDRHGSGCNRCRRLYHRRGGGGSRSADHGGGNRRFTRERVFVFALRGDDLEGAGLITAGGGGCGRSGRGGGGAFAAGETGTAGGPERAEGRRGGSRRSRDSGGRESSDLRRRAGRLGGGGSRRTGRYLI